jgi:hypothetical protein
MNPRFLLFIIIILGGALVLFIYISRIASNEKFILSTKLIWIVIIIILINILVSIYCDPIINYLPNQAIHQLSSLNKLFSIQNIIITIILASYLFLTIIAINYIVNINQGPLRSKN